MPISEDGQVVPMMPYQINVPVPEGSGFMVMLTVQSDGTPGAGPAMDAALMSLTDLLQEWEGRHPAQDVTAQKTEFRIFHVTPSNPLPPPPPPGDEPITE